MQSLFPFLGTLKLGLFGAGHLGRAIGQGLLDGGFPQHKLVICHRGSKDTQQKLAEASLSDCVAPCDQLIRDSKIILYLVRPQNYQSIADYQLCRETLIVSFLAGFPLARIPVSLPVSQRVRVMTSAPDTIQRKNGIAAMYPGDDYVVREILASLKLKILPLRQEDDVHAFTAFGPCLPIALTYLEGLKREINEGDLVNAAARFGLPEYGQVLAWARSVHPRNLSTEERDRYIAQATTPGGVTEAILKELKAGKSLSDSLIRGVQRSRELAEL